MLRNFIEHTLKRISDTGKVGRKLSVAYHEIKKIQDSAVCRSPKAQDAPSESQNDPEPSYMMQEKSVDNSLQIIQNNFSKPSAGTSAPSQNLPQRRVFGRARDTIK